MEPPAGIFDSANMTPDSATPTLLEGMQRSLAECIETFRKELHMALQAYREEMQVCSGREHSVAEITDRGGGLESCINNGESTMERCGDFVLHPQGKAAPSLSVSMPVFDKQPVYDSVPVFDQHCNNPDSSLALFSNTPVYDVKQAKQRAESQTISFEMGLTEVEQWRPVLEKVDDLELEPDCVIYMASSPASRPQASSTGAVAMESVLDSVHVSTTAASTDVVPSSYQPTNLAGLRLKASVPVSTMDNNVPLWPLNAAATPTPTLVVPYGMHIGAPTKCSSMGLDIDTDSGEVNITPLLVVSMSKDITKPMVISEFFLSELFAGVEFIFLLPTKYLMYCVSCVTDSDLHEVINIGTLVPASVIAGWVLRGAECFNFDPGITISMFCNNDLEQWPPPTSVCIICSNIDVRPIPWPSFGMSKGCPGSELSWIWKPPWLHLPWQIIRWKSVTVHSLNWEFSSGPLHPTQGITFQTLVLLSRNTSSTCIKFCLEVGSSSSSGHVTDSAYFLELPQGYWSNLHQLCLSGVELKQPYVMVLCTFSMCIRGGYLLIVWLEGILGAGICTKIDGVAAVLEKKVGQGIQADYSCFVANLIGDNIGSIVAREADILECIAAEIITVVILRRTMREHCSIEDILDCTLVFSWCYFPCPDDNSEGVVLILHQEKLPYVVVQWEDATLLIGYGRSDWKLPWLWDPIKSFQEGCLVFGRLCLELFRSLLFAIQLTQEGSFRCKGNFWLYPQVFLLACCQSKGTKDCTGVSFKFLEDNVFCMMVSSARLAFVLTDELHRMLENDGTTVHGAMKQLIFTCMVKELEKVLAVNFYEHRLEDKPNLEGRIMSCIGSFPYGLVSVLTMTGHIAEGHKRNGKRRVTA